LSTSGGEKRSGAPFPFAGAPFPFAGAEMAQKQTSSNN
jgi:hypothetical protein